MGHRIRISVSSLSKPGDPHLLGRRPTVLDRLKMALAVFVVAVLAASIVVAAIILGSLIAALVGISVVIALATWVLMRTVRRSRSK